LEIQNQKTETREQTCFSSEVRIAAVEKNASGVFTKEFKVVTSNNISVDCAFFSSEHSKNLSFKHSLDWACELKCNNYL